MAGHGPQPLDRRQAWYGPSYLHNICAQAGYLWTPVPADGDVHSFDGTVSLVPGFGVPVQVKCRRKPIVRSASYLIQKAWRANWSDLTVPAFFVVVVVPPDVTGWVHHEVKPEKRTVHNTSAYWTRIDPLGPEQQSIQVTVGNRLTSDTIENWREIYELARADGFKGGGAS